MSSQQAPVVVWFRNDLRLSDHPALTAAIASGGAVVTLYVLDDAAADPWPPGGASRWWLHHSLDALQRSIGDIGGRLILRRGDTMTALRDVIAKTGAETAFCSRSFLPAGAALERRVHDQLREQGVSLKRYAGSLLHDPDKLRTQTGNPYQVFTPFWRALSGAAMHAPLPAPKQIADASGGIASDELAEWQLLPTKPDWAGGLRETWRPGEAAARERLATFIDTAMQAYDAARDRPGEAGTSRLSPHLAFGEISPAQIWHAVRHAEARSDGDRPAGGSGAQTFLKEIAWREFSYHLLHNFPDLPQEPFRKGFDAFPWAADELMVKAWQQGRTGYPIVDAGMRELWANGWMHNRVRMITASFLTKHLLVPWQQGEAWFWDCLVDADLASNAASWQWVAGSGADAAPYFRIFNPILQGSKFDAAGDYVRHWVPEIAKLPDKHLHAPWQAPERILKAAGVILGETYPSPIVDHKMARERALAAYAAMRGDT